MAESRGLKVFSESFSEANVKVMFNQIKSALAKELGRTEQDIENEINNFNFSEDLKNKIIKEFEKAEKSLGGRSFTFSKDLFKNLFDADGAEEQINEIVKTFENKIESLIRVKDRINNDEIFFKIDTTQLDELIKKEEKLIELEEKRRNLLNNGKSVSGNTKSRNKIQQEIDDIISNLNIDSGKLIDSKEVQQEVNKSKKSIKELKKELNSIYNRGISPDTTNKKQIDDMKQYVKLYHEYVELVKSSGGTVDGELEGGFNYFLNNNEVKAYNDSLLKSKQNTSAANTELSKYIVTLDEAKKKAQELVKNNNLRPSNITDNINISEIKDVIGYIERYISLGGELKDLDFTAQKIYNKKDQVDGINELTNAIRNYKNEAQDLGSVNNNGFNNNGLKSSKEDAEALLSVIKEIRDTLNQLKDKSFLNIGENFAEDLVGGEEKLKETFQALSDTIYNELTDAFNDFVAQLNDVDTKQDWSFNNLRQSLLDIVTQFQNSLSSVNLSSTQLDEAYKMIKGWNDADSYSVTRGNATSHERGAFLNSKTGTVSNSYFIDAEKSFGVQLFNALEKLSVGLNGEISSIYDTFIHSHPFRTAIDNLKTTGSDIGFSYSDLDVAISKFLKEKINNMMVTSNYKYANLDLSGVEETIAKELLNHFRSELVKSGLELDGNNRIVFPKDLATNNGVFDFDQKSEIVNGALKQALKNVGLEESRLTTGNIEDLKIDLSQLEVQSEETKGTFQELLDVLKNISSALTEINTKGFKFDTTELSGSDQNKLQSELDETKGKLESLSKEAEETKKQLDELKQANVGADVGQGSGEQPEKSPIPKASESEQQALEKLKEAINTVKEAIDNKTESIKTEEKQMNDSVNAEIAKLEELKSKLTEIKTQFESGIASGLFKDVNGNNTTIPGEVTLSPKLSETFKTDADNLLSKINVEKEVNFKVGELSSTSNTNIDNKFSESFSDSIIKDFDVKNKDFQKRVKELVKSLSDISIDEILLGKENNNFISVLNELGDLITKNANIIQQKTGIYDDFYNYLKGISNIKIPDIVKTDLGDDWNTLRKTWSQKFSTTKGIELDSIYQEMSNEFKDLFSGTADPTEQFKEIVNAIKLYREDVKKAIPLTDDDIQEIYNQVVNRIGEMRNKIKTDLGVSLDESEFKDLNKENNIRLEPLVDQSEWEEEIDRILSLIGTKKIKIEPDTSSQEWNEFKTFIDKISNLVVKFNFDDNSDSNNGKRNKSNKQSDEDKTKIIQSEASYQRSEEYLRKVWYYEEEIAKLRESNAQDLEIQVAEFDKLITKYKELLATEKSNRESNDLVTEKGEQKYTSLENTLKTKYDSNRATYQEQLPIEINKAYDEASIEYSNKLLSDQLNIQKQIEESKTRLVQLERESIMSDEDELAQNKAAQDSLRQEISLLEKRFAQKESEINQFSSYINKQEQSVALEKIRTKAESDRAKLLSNSVDNSNNYARVNSLLKEQEEIIRSINILQNKQDTTGLSDTEQNLLNTLSEKFLSIQERVTEELNKQYDITAKIADRREKLASNNKINLDDIKNIDLSGDANIGNTESQINSITNAIDEANKKMQDLKRQGQTAFFSNEFSEAEKQVESFTNQLLSGDISLSQYNKEIRELQTLLSKKTEAVSFFDPGDMNKTMSQMRDIARQIPGIQEDTLKWSNSNRTLTGILEDQNGEWKKVTINAQQAGNVITRSFTNVKAPASSFSKWLDELSVKFRNLSTYLLSFVGFYEVWGAIKQGVTYVRELDTALTEMRKVSDETVESLREFQEESFKTADSIGATAKEISNSAADFMRLGYSLQEASQLAKDANIYANVGDMDIDEATEHMVSSIKAWGDEFNSEVEASTAIIDRYNEIGNNFAISSADIGSAMERSGAALKAAGNDLNEALGLITAGNLIQQDADVTAAALRTMSLRIRGAESELEELGEETDGVTISTSKLREEIKALSGVDIMLNED